MLISDEYKFVFVHIPKTGGTSIKRALLEYANPGQLKFEGELVTDLNGYHPHVGMSAEACKKYADYFKFAFVRNPWAWHASIYRFTIHRGLHKTICSMSFKDYIEAIGRNETDYAKNQLDYIMVDGVIAVDFIGRFENLKDDFENVCKNIEIKTELPHYKNLGALSYREMYSPALADIVAEHCRSDIEYFGYSF